MRIIVVLFYSFIIKTIITDKFKFYQIAISLWFIKYLLKYPIIIRLLFVDKVPCKKETRRKSFYIMKINTSYANK